MSRTPIKPLDRRTFLRGAGVALALPFLEAMLPFNRSWAAPRSRFATLYKGNGMLSGRDNSNNNDYWSCGGNQSGITSLSAPMQSLAPYKNYLTVVQNVSFAAIYPSGVAGHEQASPSFLTGLNIADSNGQTPGQGADDRSVVQLSGNGFSLDRMIAAKSPAPLKSLMMTIGVSNRTGRFQAGQAPQLMTNLSWEGQRTDFDGQQLRDPADAYRRLVSSGLKASGGTTTPPAPAPKISVLDAVRGDLGALMGSLGAADKQVMGGYLGALQQVETDLKAGTAPPPAGGAGACTPPSQAIQNGYAANSDVQYSTVTQAARQFSEIMALAFQCGITDVSTLMLSYDWSVVPGQQLNAAYGVSNTNSQSYHNLTHYQSDGATSGGLQVMQAIEDWHAAQAAYLAKLLVGIADSDGRTLLDNTAVLFGAGMSDPDQHAYDHMFRFLLGKGGGLNPGANGKLVDAGNSGNAAHARLLQSIAGGFGVTSTVGMSGGNTVPGVVG